MIRTRDVDPSLRIEIRRSRGRRHVALVDPATDKELLIAEDLQDSAISELNRYIWSQLDDIAQKLEKDPELGANYGGRVARQVYLTGYAALQTLVDYYSPGPQVNDVQDFCSQLIRSGAPAPPIIDIVAHERDHIFFEVSKFQSASSGTLVSTAPHMN